MTTTTERALRKPRTDEEWTEIAGDLEQLAESIRNTVDSDQRVGTTQDALYWLSPSDWMVVKHALVGVLKYQSLYPRRD